MRVKAGGHAWRVIREGEGPALVILHGFTEGIAPWQRLIERLSRRCQVVAIELLGHGASDAPDTPEAYRMPAMVDALSQVLTEVGVRAFHLLGYSLGGRIALHFALTAPERVLSLLLLSASPGIEDAAERAARRRADDELAQRIEREGVEAFAAAWASQPLFARELLLPETERRRLEEARRSHAPHGLAHVLRGVGQGTAPSVWDRLDELTMPTLCVVGAEDAKYVQIAQRCAERNRNIRVEVIPDAGHAVHRERPEAFLQAFETFWSTVAPETAVE